MVSDLALLLLSDVPVVAQPEVRINDIKKTAIERVCIFIKAPIEVKISKILRNLGGFGYIL